jgi:hypothetical protein
VEFQDKCPNCGQPRPEGASFCGNCGKPFEEPKSETPAPETPPEETSAPPPAAEARYAAWEDRENKGFFGGLWETWKESVFYPNRFFSKLPFSGGIGSPLLYALIVVWIGVAVDTIWNVLFTGIWMDMFAGYFPMEDYMWTTGFQTGFSLLYLFFAPIPIIAVLFILSGIYHLILMLFGWASKDFEATFRAIAYASGPLLFLAVPFCGSTVGWIWGLVLAIIGMKHMQTNNGGRGALVILLPLIVCCCFAILMALVFGVALTGFIREVMQSGYSY